MLHNILFAFWFLLPAAMANVTPIFAAALPGLRRLNAPMDGGKMFRGKELLGSHKTWRGFVSGIVVATLVFWLQQGAVVNFVWAQDIARMVDYGRLPTLIVGPLFAVGALGGDAIESFFKRQKGVQSGRAWIPFDQIDYIVGALIVTLPFVRLSLMQYLLTLIIWFGMHLAASYAGYKVGLKQRPI